VRTSRIQSVMLYVFGEMVVLKLMHGIQRKDLEDADVVNLGIRQKSPLKKELFTLLFQQGPTKLFLLVGQKNALILTVEITEVNRPRQQMDLHA